MIELHGNASYATCLECGLRHELEELRPVFVDRGEIPTCRNCGGLVKTATISFGQSMPEEPMLRAEAETQLCDLFLVLGSSLVVTPAALFPARAKQYGARLVIVNREPTPLDDMADLVLHDEIGPTMTAAMRDLNCGVEELIDLRARLACASAGLRCFLRLCSHVRNSTIGAPSKRSVATKTSRP